MVMMEAFLAVGGSIDFTDECAGFLCLSLDACPFFSRTEAIRQHVSSILVIQSHCASGLAHLLFIRRF